MVQVLKQARAPERIITLLEGESLFNDATAVVLFTLLVSMTLGSSFESEWQSTAITFARVFGGGIMVGMLVGALVSLLIKYIKGAYVIALVTLLAAYGAYIIAGGVLHYSGVMAVLTAGLIISELPALNNKIKLDSFSDALWQFAAELTDKIIYLLAGISITVTMFTEQWLAMILGIVAVIIARAFIILFLLPLLCFIMSLKKIPVNQLFVLNWGGVRGTVTTALALSLPFTLDAWFTVQSAAYRVILFTLFFQTGCMNYLVRKLKLDAA